MAAVTMSMASSLARPAMASVLPRRAQQSRLAARMVVRAEQGEQASNSSAGPSTSEKPVDTVPDAAEAVPTPAAPAVPPAIKKDKPVSLGNLMAFSGPAPEIINGRLAMLGFVAALGAELSTGETVWQQVKQEPTGILLTFIVFAAASLVPLLNRAGDESAGPLTPKVELINGRAAMIGFASLIAIEAVKGSALF